MKRDFAAFMGVLTVAAALAVPSLAAAADPADPADPADATMQFPDRLTAAGKQFIDQCSGETIAASADPLLASARCQSLSRQWYSQAGQTLPRQSRNGTLKSSIPTRDTVMLPVNRAL
jgi:hypothetical protein